MTREPAAQGGAGAQGRPRSKPRRRGEFLGAVWPHPGWLHRVPAGAKVFAVLVLSVPVVVARDAVLNTAIFLAVVLVALTARLPLSRVVLPVVRLWPIIGLLVVGNLVFTDALTAARVVSGMIAGVIGASVLMLTTSISELLTVFTVLARPLRWVGVRPELAGLAAALTVRSVPHIADLADTACDSARARGLERSIRARSVPVVLGTIHYGVETGAALEARGLVEPDGGSAESDDRRS